VRISDLARSAGLPLTAVKYYQREGLVPEGERSAPNQVEYGEAHVRRVRLIRALLETGGLSIASTKKVLQSLDTHGTSIAETFGVAQHALATARATESTPSAESRERVVSLARSLGWTVSDDNPGIAAAARALDGLRAIGFVPPQDYLDAYAHAAASAATADLRALQGLSDADRVAELMVVGTVLGDPLFVGLRRLAQQDATHELSLPQFPGATS
jgi:DNA-binding transcriptional MerR regulator